MALLVSQVRLYLMRTNAMSNASHSYPGQHFRDPALIEWILLRAVEVNDNSQHAGGMSRDSFQRNSMSNSSASTASSPKALLKRFSFDGTAFTRHSVHGATTSDLNPNPG